MNRKFHGLLSLALFMIAVLIGLFFLMNRTLFWGLTYAVILIVSPLVIVYSFCSKCLCRFDECGHVFPGKLSQRLPLRKQGSYTFWDYTGVMVPFLALLLFPQIWLWQNKVVWFIFWLLIIIAIFEIRLFVCLKCRNVECPLCKKAPAL